MKNKKLLLLMVLLISVVGSVMVEAGIMDSIRGVTGGVSIIHILVNTILIALFIFIVTHLLPENFGGKFFKATNNTAKVVSIIALVGISVFFAIRVGGMFVWNEDAVVRPVYRYLFGGDPLGILRPTRILIFIGGAFLLYWLFTQTIDIGKGNKDVDLVIAILLSADMTHQGLTADWLITFGQIISIWLLYKQFKKEGEAGWNWSAFVWASGLVIWVSAIAFPGKGFFLVRAVGAIFKSMGLYASLLLIIILAIIFSVGGLFVIKSKDKEKEKKRGKLRKKGWEYATTTALDMARMSDTAVNRVLIRDKSPDGEIPFIFRRLRVEINVLINYLLRLQVYRLKQNNVDVKAKIARQANWNLKSTWSSCRQKGNSYQKRMGLRAIQNFDTSWSFVGRGFTRIKEDGVMHNDICDTHGTLNSKQLIYRFFTLFKNLLEDEAFVKSRGDEMIGIKTKFWREQVDGNSFENDLGNISDHEGTWVTTNYKDRTSGSRTKFGEFVNMIGNYGTTQIRDSCRIGIFDQTRKYGLYKHSYKFARPWARPFWASGVIMEGQVVEIPGPPPRPRETDPIGYVDGVSKWQHDTGQLHEVDETGRILEDINNIENEEVHNDGDIVEFRKVRFNERVEHSALSHFLHTLVTEWDYAMQDIRKGQFHKNVRLVTEFLNCHNNPPFDWAYRGVYRNTAPRPAPEQGSPAFDREALKDPGNFVYKGIKNLYHSSQNDLEQPYFINDIPAVTTMGLTRYIQSLLNRIEGNMESKKVHAETYAWDDGEKMVSSFKIEEKPQGDQGAES